MSATPKRPRLVRRNASGGPGRIGDRDRPILSCTFDCYGTLIDWRAGIEDWLGGALRELGYAGTQSVFLAYLKSERAEEERYAPYRDVLASTAMRVAEGFGIELPTSKAREFADSLPTWPAFSDTVEVLRELGRRGVERYILSNVDRDLLQETLRRNVLEIDGFVTADEVRSYKPALPHWLRFFREYPVNPSTHLHVAQSLLVDIVPATKLGLRTAWVNRYDAAPPSSVRPTYTLDDLRELLTLMER